MIGALIGAGTSLLGGLFGSKKKKEEVVNRVDYARMVKDSEAAGFNPLTALRNGGAAGFSVQSMPSMTQSNIWGDAVAGAFNAWNNYDPHAQKREDLTHSLMQAQLKNIEADTRLKLRPDAGAVNRRSFDIPVKIASQQTKGTSLADAPAGLGKPKTPDVGDVAVTNPWEKAVVSPNVRDAQNFEDRYGDSEIAQMLYGAYVGANDIGENLRKRYRDNSKSMKREKPKNRSTTFDVLSDLYKGGLKPRMAKGVK